MKLNRRQLLGGGIGAAMVSPLLAPFARATPSGAKQLVVVMAQGAWDVTYVFDPREPPADPYAETLIDGPWRREKGGPADNPDEQIFEVGDLRIAYNDDPTDGRPAVSAFFAEWSDLCVVVNGIAMGSIVHDLCRTRLLTGSRRSGDPDLGAIFGATFQGEAPIGYLDFAGQGFVGPLGSTSARVGSRGQLELLIDDSSTGIPAPSGVDWTYPQFLPSSDDEARVQAWLQAREARLRGETEARGLATDHLDAWLDNHGAAMDLRAQGPEISEYIALGQKMDIQEQIDLAVSLLGADPTLCQAVLIDTGLPWDSHSDNSVQNDNFQTLFSGLSYLAESLGRERLEEDVLVVVLSEFTRTPKLNGDDGKDHWPVASAMLFGAGIEGQRTLGETDSVLDTMPVDLETGLATDGGVEPDYGHLIAGILEAAGIDPGLWLPDATPYSAIRGAG